jgi:hypothetical protein
VRNSTAAPLGRPRGMTRTPRRAGGGLSERA